MKVYIIILIMLTLPTIASAMEYCNGTIIYINETDSNTSIEDLIPINDSIVNEVINNTTLELNYSNNTSNCNLDLIQLCSSIKETEPQLQDGYCNVSLKLETDKSSYQNKEKITINNILSNKSYNFTIDYWIEDDKSNILKERISTTNTNLKQFTPSLSENTTLIIKNNLRDISCNNINTKTYNELKIFVEVQKSPISNISLDKLYINRSKKINIGENLTATISAYSGNNSYYQIRYFIENITNITQNLLINKFNYTTFNLTVNIPRDCTITTDYYTINIQALNSSIKQNITIINNCINDSLSMNNSILTPSAFFNSTSYPPENIINAMKNTITGDTIYESANVKAKKIAIYLLIVILAAVGLIIISKNKTIQKWYSQLEQI